jgi:hypothetical protein
MFKEKVSPSCKRKKNTTFTERSKIKDKNNKFRIRIEYQIPKTTKNITIELYVCLVHIHLTLLIILNLSQLPNKPTIPLITQSHLNLLNSFYLQKKKSTVLLSTTYPDSFRRAFSQLVSASLLLFHSYLFHDERI